MRTANNDYTTTKIPKHEGVNTMRTFVDERYTDIIITETQLYNEYLESDEHEEITFAQYINNCLASNNGTLTEIK